MIEGITAALVQYWVACALASNVDPADYIRLLLGISLWEAIAIIALFG